MSYQENKTNINVVRDRTLILRILVPGLHTSLHDKITTCSNTTNSNTTNHPNNTSSIRTGYDITTQQETITTSLLSNTANTILNLDGVSCLPSSRGSTLWHFRCDGATYPARLVNLPCPVEVHKTHDHANYHKSADIGQMLIVYEDEYAMEEAEADNKHYRVEGFPSYYPSGLSPPMHRVVQRRYLARFEERDTKPCPPPPEDVSIVEQELLQLMSQSLSIAKAGKTKASSRDSNNGGTLTTTSSNSTMTKSKVIEEIEEEIVDYEPWMGEGGGVYTIEDAKSHPEWWLSREDMREIEEKKLIMEKKRIEQEGLEKQKQEHELQQQQQQQQQKARLSSPSAMNTGDKKQTSIQNKKSKSTERGGNKGKDSGGGKKKSDDSGGKRNKKQVELLDPSAEEIDEAMRIAITINEGTAEDEDLIDFDDMFDFSNENIADLL